MTIKKVEIQEKIREKKLDIGFDIDTIMKNCYFDDILDDVNFDDILEYDYFDDADGNLIISDDELRKNKEILSALDDEIGSLLDLLFDKRARVKSWLFRNNLVCDSE